MMPVDGVGESVAIVGFGVEGESLLRVISQKSPNTKIVIFDENSNVSLSEEYSSRSNIEIVSGSGCLKSLDQFMYIYKSPGISLYRPEIQNAIKQGSKLSSAMQLWMDNKKGGTTIFVTGSKGKSTTASLVFHVLKGLGHNVILGGNIGVPMTELIDIDESPDYWVIEASSYQLADLDAKPDIAVILNLFPEHLDWHGGVEQYYEDKVRLFRDSQSCFSIINSNFVELQNFFENKQVLTFNDPEHCHFIKDKFYSGKRELFSNDGFKLYGKHNMENMCAVLSLLIHLDIPIAKSKKLLQEFKGLPHRLEYVASINEVIYINDSVSTIPQSSMAAINSYLPRWVTVIIGGFDRGLDWEVFSKWLIESGVSAIVGMPDTGHKIIKFSAEIKKHNKLILIDADSLEEAVDLAKQITPIGGVVLLSPAAPSYNLYINYKGRGDAFKKCLVENKIY